MRRRRKDEGGLFPEDGRRTKPVVTTPGRDTTPESCLRSRILKLLHSSEFQAAVTDAKTVDTRLGKRQLVWPEGWPDITASFPVTGRSWAIEVKAEGEELRDSQVARLAELEAAGWLVTVAEGEAGVAEVEKIVKLHLDYLWANRRREFQEYLLSLRRLRQEAAQREAASEATARARQPPASPRPA